MIKINDAILLTFPRSGSTALEKSLLAKCEVVLDKTHIVEESKNKKIITVIRDPLESMTSFIAMTLHYFPDIENSDNWKRMFGDLSWTGIFNEIYDYLILNANLVITYEGLMDNLTETTKLVSDFLNLKMVNPNAEITVGDDNPSAYYLSTSKRSPIYDEAIKKANSLDLTSCYERYNKIKSNI